MSLRHTDIASSVYSLHLEAPINTAQYIWDRVKSWAALHLAREFPDRIEKTLLVEQFCSAHGTNDVFHYGTAIFEAVLRCITSRNPTVHFPCDMGTLDDLENEIARFGSAHTGQPAAAWQAYEDALFVGQLNTSEVDFEAIQKHYVNYSLLN